MDRVERIVAGYLLYIRLWLLTIVDLVFSQPQLFYCPRIAEQFDEERWVVLCFPSVVWIRILSSLCQSLVLGRQLWSKSVCWLNVLSCR